MIATVLFTCAYTYIVQAQEMSMHMQTGIIRIKMASENIINTSNIRKMSTTSQPLSVGITKFDALSQKYNITGAVRVFPNAGSYEEKHKKYGLNLWYDLTIDENADPYAAAGEFCASEGVVYAEPMYKIASKGDEITKVQPIQRLAAPNDPSFPQQWGFSNIGSVPGSVANVDIHMLDAWNIAQGKPNVIVAVMDEGVDYTHQDLTASMWVNPKETRDDKVDNDGNGYADDIYGFNFALKTGKISPGNHGTHVAGIIAASNNNGVGISSIAGGSDANSGVKIMSCQIFSGAVAVSAAPAFVYAADNGAIIAQNSWGYTTPGAYNQIDRDAIDYFISEAGKDAQGNPKPDAPMNGGIVIFSAGNSSDNSLWYPAAFPETIAVGAVGPSGKRAYYSNYGSWITLSAPGGTNINLASEIYSTIPNNQYAYMQGTSMACPHVSGVAALILSKYGNNRYSSDTLRRRLEASTTDMSTWDPDYYMYMGSGLLNAAKALAPYVSVKGISLPSSLTLYVGRTVKQTNLIIPNDAFDQRITWTSSDPSVVSVNSRGEMLGIKAGTVRFTATTRDGGYIATTTATVIATPLSGLSLSPKDLTLSVGDRYQITPTFNPPDAANKTLTWKSSDEMVLKVNALGYVTALAEGTAIVVATSSDGTISANLPIAVLPLVNGITVSPKNLNLMIGQSITLKAAVSPSNAANQKVKWTSSDNTYVKVDTLGKVTAIRAGNANGAKISVTIIATTVQNSYSDRATITVYSSPEAPQGFSPNNDGFNDYFKMVLNSESTYTLKVFDRSGTLCYSSDNYQNDWDGTANSGVQKGKKILPGTYYYVLVSLTDGTVHKDYVVVRY